MSVITPQEKKIFGYIRKRFGKQPFYGQIVFGRSDYGSDLQFFDIGEVSPFQLSGIYQVRTRYNKKVVVRQKYYVPIDPKTASQIVRRSVFASAVSAWKSLSESLKDEYRKKSSCKKRSGYNVFLSEYLKSN